MKIRQYKICIACQRSNARKITRLHLNDHYCRRCGANIHQPTFKGQSWDLIEEPVKDKNITWYPGTIIVEPTYPYTVTGSTSGMMDFVWNSVVVSNSPNVS